jgi:hypothetical protein
LRRRFGLAGLPLIKVPDIGVLPCLQGVQAPRVLPCAHLGSGRNPIAASS